MNGPCAASEETIDDPRVTDYSWKCGRAGCHHRSVVPNPMLSVTVVVKYTEGMSIDQIAAEALRLPPKERALLAESLWESLADPFKIPAEADDKKAVALALERDRQLETGEVQPLSHEEMMSRLRR